MARRGACASVRGEDWRCERAFVWTYVAVLERLGQHPKSIQRGICFIHLSGAVYASLQYRTVVPRSYSVCAPAFWFLMYNEIRLRRNK